MSEDCFKLEFAIDAFDHPEPFQTEKDMHGESRHVMRWKMQRSAKQIVEEREAIMKRLEERAERYWYHY